MICGIDPGVTGGVAFLTHHDSPLLHLMPVLRVSSSKREIDMPVLADLLAANEPSLVVLERVHSLPKQGIASAFSFGRTVGRIEGLCAAYKTVLVSPQEWKRFVLKDTDKSKEAAIAFCRRRWPYLSLIPPGCTKPHHGIAESLCLAYYGVLSMSGLSKNNSFQRVGSSSAIKSSS
jgi:hypothetical protein